MQLAEFAYLTAPIKVALVESECIEPSRGDVILRAIGAHFPVTPAMLVSIESNGFRAHAHFQTQKLLALLQLERIAFTEFDLNAPLPEPELPF